MTFLWPLALWFLLPALALPLAYFGLLRRRKRALRVANIGLIREAVAGGMNFRRHMPPAMLYAALLLMCFALSRPTALITLPSERVTVVLALDISGSMRAQDVEPSRIQAAQAAARAFIADQPRAVRIGLVAFSGNAMIAQMPTLNREDLIAAIDRLHPEHYTAVGRGIIASLQAIFPEMESELYQLSTPEPQAAALGALKEQPHRIPQPVPPGSYASAIVVLMSDGRTNVGIPPGDAAQIAADLGVRVYTVGFGSQDTPPADMGGHMWRFQLDEEALKTIADVTHAKYYNAHSANDLKDIYKTLSAQFVAETKRTELTALVAAPAFLLLVIACVLSLLWSNRLT